MSDDSADDCESDVSHYSSDGEIQCSFRQLAQATDCDNPLELDGDEAVTYFLTRDNWESFGEGLLHTGNGSIHPMGADVFLTQKLRDIINHLAKGCFTYILSPAQSFLEDANNNSVPRNSLCTVFVFSPNRPVSVLTFVSTDPDKAAQYNSRLARVLTTTIRLKASENFHLINGVIDQEIWTFQTRFDDKLNQLQMEAKKTAIPGSMTMDGIYQQKLVHVFEQLMINKKVISSFSDRFSLFVKTAAYEAARDQLHQGNVLILTGGPGEGKTTIGHRLCYDYHQQGYNTVFYSREQDINWDVLNATCPSLVVWDNVAHNRLKSELIKVSGNTFVNVVALVDKHKYRKHYVNTPNTSKESIDYFENHTIDVSNVRKQDFERAKQDSLHMLQKLGPDTSETILEDIIMNLSPYVGFPKAVKLYRKYKHCVDPFTYFTYPLHYFMGEIAEVTEISGIEEWVYMIICGGNCEDVYQKLGNTSECFMAMRHFFPWFNNSENVGERLLKYQDVFFYTENTEETKCRVVFSHPVIYDACLFVVDRKYPGHLWKHCKVVFERENEPSQVILPKLTVFISKYNTDMFLREIVGNLTQGKFRHSLSHGVLRTRENIDTVFSRLGDKLGDIIQAEEESQTFLYWIVHSNNRELLKIALEKTEFTQIDVNKVLITCIKLDEAKSFLALKEELVNSRNEKHMLSDSEKNNLLMMAVERDNILLAKNIANHVTDWKLKNNQGNTALHLACLTGNLELVKVLLDKMRDSKNMAGQDLRTPVMMAALEGHGQLYEYLADVEKCCLAGVDDNGDTILHLACVGGNMQIVKHLVSRGSFDKNQRGQHGKTPLLIAAYSKHWEMFDWLLEQKCKISFSDFGNLTLAAHNYVKYFANVCSVLQSRERGLIQKQPFSTNLFRKGLNFAHENKLTGYLESKNVKLSFEDTNGTNLIHKAASTGHVELADFLISQGQVDINIRDGRGRTPVMLAAAEGHGQLFDFLIDRGADVSLKDETSSGILHFACQGQNSVIIDKVMGHGFTDVNSTDDFMKTPISYAVEAGDKNTFDKLKGGRLSGVDINQNTLLHLACKGGSLAIVQYLLSMRMIDINSINRENRTPLLVAVSHEHTDVCRHLIGEGADLYKRDKRGNCVLHIAVEKKHMQLTKYILDQDKEYVNITDRLGKTGQMRAAERGDWEMFSILVKDGGLDLSHRDTNIKANEDNILHFACTGGNVNIVKYILSLSTVDINSRDSEGRTPVMRAVKNAHKEVYDILVKKGCDLSAVDEHGDNILHVASIGGSEDTMLHLLDQNIVDINSKGKRGKTLLMLTAEKGYSDVFDSLVHKTCDLSTEDKDGNNILHLACRGGVVKIVRYVLSQNMFDINSPDQAGRTPVMLAAEKGNKDVFDFLVTTRPAMSLVDSDNTNILHLACIGGNFDIVQYILSLDILDINSTDGRRRTPVMWAVGEGHKGVFDLLVRKRCRLSGVDKNGYSILHFACIGDNVDIATHILSQDITDINRRDNKGRTPLIWAVGRGNKPMFDLLVSKKCDLTAWNKDKNNILHVACIGGCVDIVHYILSLDMFDINIGDAFRRTPLMIAEHYGHSAVVELLRCRGAHD